MPIKTNLRLPDFGAAEADAGAAAGAVAGLSTAGCSTAGFSIAGFSIAGFSIAGLAGVSTGRRAVVSSARCERSWSARARDASPAASPSAISGPVRRMRAAWSLAAAITALPIALSRHKFGQTTPYNFASPKLALTERFGQDITYGY